MSVEWNKRRWTWRRIAAGVVGVVVLWLAVAVGWPLFQLWQQTRTIDHTVAHGDECLGEPVGENYRCWDLHLPADAADEELPLVIDIHGFLNRPSTQREFSNFNELADEQGFVVAWPYGINWSWNGGGDPWPNDTKLDERLGIGCCGHALNEDVDDVEFIRQMIITLIERHDVDPDRVYVSGFSTGCFLAQRIAAEASDLVAGVACMSGFLLTDIPSDYQPMPVFVINGTNDSIVTYERDYWPGAINNFDRWTNANGCSSARSTETLGRKHTLTSADDCTDDAVVSLLTLDGQGHVTYEGHDDLILDTTRLAWKFLEDHNSRN